MSVKADSRLILSGVIIEFGELGDGTVLETGP
jgi:hypothetical protein